MKRRLDFSGACWALRGAAAVFTGWVHCADCANTAIVGTMLRKPPSITLWSIYLPVVKGVFLKQKGVVNFLFQFFIECLCVVSCAAYLLSVCATTKTNLPQLLPSRRLGECSRVKRETGMKQINAQGDYHRMCIVHRFSRHPCRTSSVRLLHSIPIIRVLFFTGYLRPLSADKR